MAKESKIKRIFSLMGPPGCGKSFVSKRCQNKKNFFVLSLGDLCRKHVALQTDFGKEVYACWKEKKLVPDKLITNVVLDWLVDIVDRPGTIVIDGYPRTSTQASLFTSELKRFDLENNFFVINFLLSENLSEKHLSDRIVCKNIYCQSVYNSSFDKQFCENCGGALGKRSDDIPSSIKERIQKFPLYKRPLLRFYAEEGVKVVDFDADKDSQSILFLEFENQVLRRHGQRFLV